MVVPLVANAKRPHAVCDGMLRKAFITRLPGGKGEPLNRSREVADATMCAIGGRIAAYTGKLVRWVDLTENTNSAFYNLSLAPSALDFEKGEVAMPDESPAVPGAEKAWKVRA